MADISLVFGVAGEGSLSGESGRLIQEQLQGIVSEINNKPLEVKVKISQESLTEIQTQIADIAKQLNNGVSPFGNTTNSNMAAGVAQITQQITAASGALHSMDVAMDTSNISTLKNSLLNLGTEMSVNSIDSIASAFTNLDFIITDVTPEVQNLGREGSRLTSLLIQGANEAGDTIKQKLRFDKNGKLLDDLSKIKVKLAEVAKLSNSTDNSSKNTQSGTSRKSEEYRKAVKAVREYYAELKKLSSAEHEAFAKREDKLYIASGAGERYANVVKQMEALNKAYEDAKASARTMSETERASFNDVETSAQNSYNASIERGINFQKQYTTVMTSSNSAVNQANAILGKCTKAEHSHNESSRQAVETIREKLAAVVQAQNAVKTSTGTDEEKTLKTLALKDAEKELRQALKEQYGVIQQNGDATKGLGERIVGLGKKFTTWFGVSQIIMQAYRAVRKMISSAVELDTAMTELKKVTDETDETYQRFLENASTRAKKLGTSLTDVVKTTADFARLGFTIDEAETVSDAALVYKNVGDGIEDIDQASESIISTMQAFGVETDDVMTIVDKFNTTGNKFAISSGGVGDALLNSAAALNAAGNSLDESIGLITAANTTIQDPEKVGKCYAQQYSNVLKEDSYIG